jgi:hypothetical protein
VGSSDSTQLTHAKDTWDFPFWSHDGSLIFYKSGGNLWAVAPSGGSSEMVHENVDAAALHPDGNTLVSARAGKMWAGERKGASAKELRIPQIPDAVPVSFSPDGPASSWKAAMPRRSCPGPLELPAS